MAKSQTMYLTGKGAWFHKLFEPDDYQGVEKWKFNFYPDARSMEKFKALGTTKKIKNDDIGEYVILDRPVDKPWPVKDGENPQFDPPRITDADGEEWPSDMIIGNGSSVTIKISPYQFKFKAKVGTAVRLEAVRVDEWVEYVPPKDTSTQTVSESPKTVSKTKLPTPF